MNRKPISRPQVRSSPVIKRREQGPRRKIGRYVLLVLIVLLSSPFWFKQSLTWISHLKTNPKPSIEEASSSSSKANKKSKKASSSSSVPSSSAEQVQISSEAVKVDSPPSPWNHQVQGNQRISSLEVSSQLSPKTLPRAEGIDPNFLAHAVSEARQNCGNKTVLIKISTDLKAPFYERSWSWQCQDQTQTFHLVGNPQNANWIRSNGCRKGAPCWQKPMASYIPFEEMKSAQILRFRPTVPSTIVSPEKLQVLAVQQDKAGLQLTLGYGFSWKIDIRGFGRFNPAVKVGQIFEKGSPLGESRGDLPLDLGISYQNRKLDWSQAIQYSFPDGVKP